MISMKVFEYYNLAYLSTMFIDVHKFEDYFPQLQTKKYDQFNDFKHFTFYIS